MSDSTSAVPVGPPPVVEPPHSSHSPPSSGRWRYLLTELVIVTAGVLIALSVDSYREWRQNRALVEEARRNITQEILDNSKRLEQLVQEQEVRAAEVDNALTLVNDLLKTKKSAISSYGLNLSLLDVGDANWKSAERTGALGHMDYAEVREYSELYEVQALYADHQRWELEHVREALSTIDGDPSDASVQDLQLLRARLLTIRADRFLSDKFRHDLIEAYKKTLER